MRYAAGAVVAASLLGGVGAAAGATPAKAVTITVDGHARTVHTPGKDVRDALRRAGVTVGSHDVVAPALGTAVHDGSRIVVAHGRPLTLLVDGHERTIWVTQQTVGEAVQALGLRLDGAYVSASRSGRIPLSGTTVVVQLPHRVTLVADGRRRVVRTTAVTVADFLAERHIRLGRLDRLNVGLDRAPADGLVVRIFRVGTRRQHVVIRLDFHTRWVADPSMYRGHHEVRTAGRAGRADRWYQLTFVDGKLAKRKLVRWHRRPATTRVIAYGTKRHPAPPPPPAPSYPSSSSGLDWAALAQCESGGNPRLVDPPYYGLYQFTTSTWASVGGSGLPSDASSSEQTYRAQLLYDRSGRSPWPVCGRYL